MALLFVMALFVKFSPVLRLHCQDINPLMPGVQHIGQYSVVRIALALPATLSAVMGQGTLHLLPDNSCGRHIDGRAFAYSRPTVALL